MSLCQVIVGDRPPSPGTPTGLYAAHLAMIAPQKDCHASLSGAQRQGVLAATTFICQQQRNPRGRTAMTLTPCMQKSNKSGCGSNVYVRPHVHSSPPQHNSFWETRKVSSRKWVAEEHNSFLAAVAAASSWRSLLVVLLVLDIRSCKIPRCFTC